MRSPPTTNPAPAGRGTNAPIIELQPLTMAHLDAIKLRPEDAREVTPGWQQRAMNSQVAYAGIDREGRVVAVYGVDTNGVEIAPWLLCSALAKKYGRFIFSEAHAMVQELRASGQLVFNVIPKDSHGNRRFIQRLGFRILPFPGTGPDFFYLPSHV